MCILQEGTWLPVMGDLAVVVSQAYFKEGGGSDLHQLTAPLEMVVASVRACLWGLRWQHQLTPIPGAHVGSTLPPQSTQIKKRLWGPAPQLECPQQCHLKRAYLFYFKIFNLFIYLVLAVPGLHYCTQAFSSCGEQGAIL